MTDTQDRAGFYDVLLLEDPGLLRSEQLTLTLLRMLEQNDDHALVDIAALAHLLIPYLRDLPEKCRAQLTNSLLDDIRDKVADPNA